MTFTITFGLWWLPALITLLTLIWMLGGSHLDFFDGIFKLVFGVPAILTSWLIYFIIV